MGIKGSFGKCIIDKNSYAECISIDEEQLMSFLKDNELNLKGLKIENSFIPLIELFPIIKIKRLDFLTIQNSRVKSIVQAEQGVGGFKYSDQLDLSFNDIEDTSFLTNMTCDKIVMHHNKIEFFDSRVLDRNYRLTSLDLSHNNIINITRLNRGFYYLNLSHNSIEDLGNIFENLHEFNVVDLSYNKLKAVSLNNFFIFGGVRSYLNLSNNNIHTITYTSIEPLRDMWNRIPQSPEYDYGPITINFSFNKVEMKGEIMDYMKANGLRISLIFESNNINNLDFFLNRNTTIEGESLSFRNNEIKALHPYFENCSFQELDLSFNAIVSIATSTFEGSNVEELYLNNNKLTSLNFEIFNGIFHLRLLNLSHNPLKMVDGSFSKRLQISIDISHCLLETSPKAFGNVNLKDIYLSHNNINSIEPNTFPNLELLDLSYNKLGHLKANVFSGLYVEKSLNLSFNPLSSLEGVFNHSKIKNVTLTDISLTKLTPKDLVGLDFIEHLNLNDNGIRELSNNTFDQLPKLKHIWLDNNSIQILPSNLFGFNKNLISLSIVRNPLSIIPLDCFSHKMKLMNLSLTINGKIMKKRFFNLIFLEELHIVLSKITDIQKYGFKGLVSLKKLNFENSTVSKLEPGAFIGLRNVKELDTQNLFANVNILRPKMFVGLQKLETLNLSNIGISTIEDGAFFGLDNLANLSLGGNKIGNLPKNSFLGLKSLKMLDLSHNNLTGRESTFPIGTFRDLINLTHLHLQYNRIIKFHIGEFSNLRNLRFLNISHNQLSYLDRHLLFPLKQLEVLDINSNHVIKFDYHFTLKHLSNLKMIGIGENKWPCENMTIMLNIFEQHNVNYRQISKLEFETENIGGIYCVHVCNYLYCPTEEDLVVTY